MFIRRFSFVPSSHHPLLACSPNTHTTPCLFCNFLLTIIDRSRREVRLSIGNKALNSETPAAPPRTGGGAPVVLGLAGRGGREAAGFAAAVHARAAAGEEDDEHADEDDDGGSEQSPVSFLRSAHTSTSSFSCFALIQQFHHRGRVIQALAFSS